MFSTMHVVKIFGDWFANYLAVETASWDYFIMVKNYAVLIRLTGTLITCMVELFIADGCGQPKPWGLGAYSSRQHSITTMSTAWW